jgi:hypothetical protein
MVVHADDVGMCHGANVAFRELSRRGTISAGSVMVPCPWFAELAGWAATDPSLDVGVHLTLTSEHAPYRWGPVSTPPPSSGLTDPSGFLWPTVAEVREHADPDAVEVEWRAQVERALSAGIDVTHLDAHMGSALAPEWCDRYVALGVEFDVPVLITSLLSTYGPNGHLADVSDDDFDQFVDAARAADMPIFDVCLETDFGRGRGDSVDYEALLSSAPEPLVYCAFHPCRPGPGEVEFIEPDSHHVRTDEYALFGSDEWAGWLAAQGFVVTGMRELRDERRARRSA